MRELWPFYRRRSKLRVVMLAIYTASTSSSISALIRSESVNPQSMKVVDLVDIFDLIGGRPRNSKRIKSYACFTKGRRSRKTRQRGPRHMQRGARRSTSKQRGARPEWHRSGAECARSGEAAFLGLLMSNLS